jgi:hypothetical protein
MSKIEALLQKHFSGNYYLMQKDTYCWSDNDCTRIDFSFAELLPTAKIQFLIGDIGYLFSSDVGYFYDSLGKMFLKECF